MNRIYKVIYSKARQCYIVVSELAKSNHKSSQQGADHTNTPSLARIIAVALAAGALTWGSVPEVSWAADTGQADTGQNAAIIQGGIHYFSVNPEGGNRNKNYENDGAVGVDSLAVGAGAHADGRLGATALGNDAVANGERALAVGNGSKATGQDTIAIGTGSQGEADGINAIAIGNQSHAKGTYTTTVGGFSEATAEGAVALGQQAKSKGVYSTSIGMMANGMVKDYKGGTAADFSTAVGAYSESSGSQSTAVGYSSKSFGDDSVSLGGFSEATEQFASALGYASQASLNGTAVGSWSLASATGSVALGYGSQATEQDILQSDGSDGVVSVGQSGEKGMTRRIINVKAGVNDTDAVNVSQLKQQVQEAAKANDTDTHVKAGTYAVTTVKDAAGKDMQGVALDVVNKTGTSVGTVTITDVAKASDVGDVSQLSKEVQNAGGSTTVVDAINNVNTKVNTVDNKVGDLNYSSTNYVKSGDNVTTSISNLDKAIHDATTEAGKHSTVSAGNNIKVTPDTTDGKTDYKVSLSDDINVNSVTAKTVTTDNLTVNKSATIGKVTINADDKGTIGGLTNKTWDAKKITSGQAATEDQLQAATKNAVNYDSDSSKTITLRENTTIKNVANTSIEQGSKNAVNAGTIYNETRVKQDGKYVKVSNTAGENLSALDNQVASNSSNITNLNGRVNNLNSKVNKVGAGAAALAALHPLDFDPEDKWDFAVGYGNYRDANSVAVGAFYRPDDDTMFSVGTNFGNGENMINAGVSFKFGPKGKSQVRPGSTQEITELRATVARQDDQLKKQDNEIKELKAMVQQLMAKQDKQAATK
ncbi:ESPR-type extended signal peptide-containing protein [Mitsuokella jalaludinii]|uniref:ESPR-type extended signal peptide-containing protein n=1 Tax=Mitsuokella jalaludinii TaxID=187979 RepID=UPI003078504D